MYLNSNILCLYLELNMIFSFKYCILEMTKYVNVDIICKTKYR